MRRSMILLAAFPLLSGCAALTPLDALENLGWFALGAAVATAAG